MTWTTVLTVSASVLIALAGYLATYAYNLRLAQRKDRLDRINRQLSELYGPLLALSNAGRSAWLGFRGLYRPRGAFWDPASPPTSEEAAAWRLWMTEVFMPLDERVVEAITKNADLLIESEMPQVILDICANVAGYQPVLSSWREGNFSRHTSVVDFDGRALAEYAETRFRALKAEQRELLGDAA